MFFIELSFVRWKQLPQLLAGLLIRAIAEECRDYPACSLSEQEIDYARNLKDAMALCVLSRRLAVASSLCVEDAWGFAFQITRLQITHLSCSQVYNGRCGRCFMWLNIAFLVALIAPAQNSSQAKTPYQLGSGPAPLYQLLQHQDQVPNQLAPVPQLQHLPRLFNQRRIDADELLAQQSNMCLTMRVYHFERHDDKAPVLVKTLTCAPATAILKQAGPPPNPRLVPAN
ncbi:MAG TPA: hypothetical protein VI636_22795 [Candidatus Angelobacter sp.]